MCVAVARTMQEQQLKARQLVLQQQAASAVAAASKTQREVCSPSPRPDSYCEPVHVLAVMHIWRSSEGICPSEPGLLSLPKASRVTYAKQRQQSVAHALL